METLISAFCVVALVVTAILVMTRAIDLEKAGNAVLKALAAVIVFTVVVCALRGALTNILSIVIAALKVGVTWLAFVGVVLIALMLVSRVSTRKRSRQNNSHGGDL